jgi:hypothetical protein
VVALLLLPRLLLLVVMQPLMVPLVCVPHQLVEQVTYRLRDVLPVLRRP